MHPPLPILISLTCLALASCQSHRPKLNPRHVIIREELGRLHPSSDPIVRKTEVIDMHVHTFNACYLPLRGILQGKRDKAGLLGWLISDRCAASLAQALIDRTELAPAPGSKGVARDTGHVDTSRMDSNPGFLCKVFITLINKAADKGAWNPDKTPKEQMLIIDEVTEGMTLPERLAARAAANMMGMEHAIKSPPHDEKTDRKNKASPLQPLMRFFWTITQNDDRMADLYRALHNAAPSGNGPRISIVSHMMDLGPVYNQEPGDDLLDFRTEQLMRMEDRQSRSGGDFTYFVAYNPFRDHTEGGKTGDSLKIVQDAVLHHGAKGVKVYPPSGYRVFGNQINPRPRTLLTNQPGEQWDRRYAALGTTAQDRATELDRKLEQLLLWCVQHDIPVFTHSGYGEFEARKGYGLHHSDPEWWGRFLRKHSRPGAPCRLRLCFGHAGGDDFWIGTGQYARWGETVFNLCTEYPNVYCEVTTDGHHTDPDTLAWFVSTVSDCIESSKDKSYPFATKLLYGTDWFLPDSDDPAPVLAAAQRAFLHPSLRPYYEDYFNGNARRFLN
ncbi:MAG: amidohydrolase family protein [Verrucomicrobiales bacterium]